MSKRFTGGSASSMVHCGCAGASAGLAASAGARKRLLPGSRRARRRATGEQGRGFGGHEDSRAGRRREGRLGWRWRARNLRPYDDTRLRAGVEGHGRITPEPGLPGGRDGGGRRPAGAHQITTWASPLRTIGSPALYENAAANAGMFEGAPIAAELIGACSLVLTITSGSPGSAARARSCRN